MWDNFLIDGVEYLFKTALAVIRLLSPHLVGLDIEDVLPILQVRERERVRKREREKVIRRERERARVILV